MGKPKRDPILCQVCNHNMGRSRCRVIDGKYGVRCNKCKTVYTITIKLPQHIVNAIAPLTHSRDAASGMQQESNDGCDQH